jgi:phosphate acetyltransferase
MTEEDADKLSYDNTYFGVLMLKAGDADGLVSGACHSTANTLRPGLQIVKTAPGTPLVSSYFIMVAPEQGNIYCPDGAFIYSDCGLEQNPDSEKLANIAKQAAKSAVEVLGMEPRLAFLSHSSKGSAKHERVDKVIKAVEIVKEKAPQLCLDGELQSDAALVESVGKSKAPGSPVAGRANTLVFPSLEVGNIAYKLVQRLAGAVAVGPVLQGLGAPVNDLSRGCLVEDIYKTIIVTCNQAIGEKGL